MQSDKRAKRKPSVYFIVPAPLGISPGQRFRFEHYLTHLQGEGIKFRISNFYSQSGWQSLYKQGGAFRKILAVLSGLFRRWADLFRIRNYSYVYLYREAAPLGPPFFEWVISKVLRKKIIYDFDDAIWVPVTSAMNKSIAGLKSFGKVGRICSWANTVSVGNQFLADFALKYNKQVVIIPTVVNTEVGHTGLQDQHTAKPSVGWTGTFSTLVYLDIILPVLQELQKEYDFKFVVIADKDPKLPLKNWEFVKWNRDTEAEDLKRFHIGVMPLYDNEVSRGKCGFKAIQYMSLGIPAVVSPVGVNAAIVEEGVNGYLAETKEEWKKNLVRLLTDSVTREQFGKSARQKIELTYSVKATQHIFLSLFR